MSLSKKDIKKINESKISDFLVKLIHSLTYFFDHKLMDSFDVTFEYKGTKYRITLDKNAKSDSKDLVSSLKIVVDKNWN